jgi:hypothetical protein
MAESIPFTRKATGMTMRTLKMDLVSGIPELSPGILRVTNGRKFKQNTLEEFYQLAMIKNVLYLSRPVAG